MVSLRIIGLTITVTVTLLDFARRFPGVFPVFSQGFPGVFPGFSQGLVLFYIFEKNHATSHFIIIIFFV